MRLSLFRISLKPFISALVMGIIIYPSQYVLFKFFRSLVNAYISSTLSTILAIILGGFIYVYILALTKGINNEDIRLIPNSITKYIPSVILTKINKKSSVTGQ